MKNSSLSDTRNRLDDNSHLKQKRNNSKKSFKSLKEELSNQGQSSVHKKVKKLSKGQLFKQTHGYSRTTARLMRKNFTGIVSEDTLNEYKKLRNGRKKAARKIAAQKRSDSVAIRKYGKDTIKKSSKKKG